MVIVTLLVLSGGLRIGVGVGPSLARAEAGGPAPGEQEPALTCEGVPDAALLQALSDREALLEEKEQAISDRLLVMQIAEAELEERLVALQEAETSLQATLATARTANDSDIDGLVAVYENMKPAEAAALFEEMEPGFAAGFLVRMRPDVAASVLAGLDPATAYSISAIIAGRNARVPTQ